MSRVVAVCPHCQKNYKVDVQLVGRTTECKQCKTSFEIVASEESDESFGLPEAKQYLADQPFDPLAPIREGGDDPAQTYDQSDATAQQTSKVQARDWKKELKQSRLNSPFGPIQRTLLGIGALLVLAGVAVNLMHLFGVQMGEGNAGRFVGLIVGLLGAGLVGASLLKFPASARIAGGAAALVVFLVFLASLINAKKQQEPIASTEPDQPEEISTIAGFNSPWIENYPKWVGFDEMERMPTVGERWNRHQVADTDFSASFPGKPESATERIRVSRTSVRASVLKVDVNDFSFSLMAFEFPSPRGKTDKLMLNESEKAFGEIEFAKSIEFDGCIGKEYRITSSSESTHGRFFLVGTDIVHIRVTGSSTLVPGMLSREFLGSLLVRANGNRNETALPEFELTDDQKALEQAISENVREIEALIAEHIRSGGLMNFPPAYLSISAGKDAGNRRFLVHPGKLPIRGVDIIEAKTRNGTIISNIAPIFGEPTDENSIMANEGYALAGLEVNAGAWIKGVRLVFMKITPVGFDTSKSYRSRWYGTRSSGVPERLGADGRPVFGLWMCRTTICKSIGLIRESN